MARLKEHFTPKTLKTGNSGQAEQILEQIRRQEYPDKPSRLNSYFLNTHREVAEKRAIGWRLLVRMTKRGKSTRSTDVVVRLGRTTRSYDQVG